VELGANCEQLDQLSRTFSHASGQLLSSLSSVDASLQSAWWRGLSSDMFRHNWATRDSVALRNASGAMLQLKQVIDRNKAEQQKASAVTTDGTSTVPVAALPVLIPLVPKVPPRPVPVGAPPVTSVSGSPTTGTTATTGTTGTTATSGTTPTSTTKPATSKPTTPTPTPTPTPTSTAPSKPVAPVKPATPGGLAPQKVPSASQRGWGDIGKPGSATGEAFRRANIVPLVVNGVPIRPGVHKAVKPIFDSLVRDLMATGENVGARADDWGYAHRFIGSGSTLSNHSWGLAIDIDAVTNPQGPKKTTFDVDKVHALLAGKYQGLIRWGYDYQNSKPDAMHFEFIGTPAQAAALAADLG
jgi:hypothetical protein